MTEHTYDFWQRARAGEKVGGPTLPIHADIAHPGFYRRRMKKGGALVPIAIYVHEGELVALVDGGFENPLNHWLRCCEDHVSEAAYRQALKTGQWPDVDPNIQVKAEEIVTTIAPPPIGHNAPPDEAVALKDQIETVKAGLGAYEKIKDDDTAKQAQSLRSRLLELAREVFKKHKAEKEPSLEAGRAVDDRWKPLEKDAKAAADQLADALSVFFTEKDRLAKEDERKAQAAADKAAAAGKPAPEQTPWSAPAPQPTQVKGGYGRAAPVKVVKVVKEVTDWEALWAFLKKHPDLRHFMEQLAQRAINAGHDVPGVTVEERRKVA